MALFKIEKGTAANLVANRPNAVEGYAYFTTDDGKFYIDVSGGTAESPVSAIVGTNRIPLSADRADRIPYAENNEGSSRNQYRWNTTRNLQGLPRRSRPSLQSSIRSQ